MYRILFAIFLTFLTGSSSIAENLTELPAEQAKLDTLLTQGLQNKYSNREKAREQLMEALILSRSLKKPAAEAEALKILGLISYYQDSLALAMEYFDKALLISRRIGDSIQVANILFNKGKIYKDTQQWEVALQNAFHVLKIDEVTENEKGLGYSYNYIGTLYKALEDTAKAKSCFLQSLEIRERLKHEQGIGYTCINLGNIAINERQYDSATYYFTRAAEIFKGNDPFNYAKCVYSLGNISYYNKNLNKAEQLYQQALKIRLDHEVSRNEIAESLVSLGFIASERKEFASSDSLYQLAITYTSPDNNLKSLINIYQKLLYNARKTERYSDALNFQQKYYETREKIFDSERLQKFKLLDSEFQLNRSQEELTELKKHSILIEKNAQLSTMVTGSIILLLLLIISTIIFILRLKSRHLKELNQKNQELKQINQSLDQFVSIASHDLKAPIASCKGIIEIMRELDDLEKVKEFYDLQEMSLNRLEYLIRDLLDFSRSNRDTIRIVKVDLAAKVEEVRQNLVYQKSARKVKISFHCEDNESFYSDDLRLRMILNNLISNSIRYKSLTSEKPFVKIEASINRERALIKIIDNGQGIPPEYHERVFDMFFKVSKNHKSTGLGLYIVKEAVNKLNGEVWFESTLNRGSTFYVKIPNETKNFIDITNENELSEIN